MAAAGPGEQGPRARPARPARRGSRPAGGRHRLRSVAPVALALLAGCGGGGGGGSSAAKTVLGRTLAATRSSPNFKGDFEFGDLAFFARVRGQDRWIYPSAYGTSYFREDPRGKKTGLDPTRATVGLVVGAPPHTGARISGPGIDTARVKAALTRLGAQPGKIAGQDGLVWGAEGSTHIGAADEFGTGPALGEFDRTILRDHTVVAARFDAEAAALAGAGSGASLAEKSPFRELADCLGDVVAAQGAPDPGAPGVVDAAGVRRPADPGAPVTEVLCATGGDQARLARTLRRRARLSTILPTVQIPLSHYLAKLTVARGDGWIRATATDRRSSPPGFLLKALAQGDAQTLFGSPARGP